MVAHTWVTLFFYINSSHAEELFLCIVTCRSSYYPNPSPDPSPGTIIILIPLLWGGEKFVVLPFCYHTGTPTELWMLLFEPSAF